MPNDFKSFADIREDHTKKEFYPQFYEHLSEELIKSAGKNETAYILNLLKCGLVTILNKETFFETNPVSYTDVGISAYEKGLDPMEYVTRVIAQMQKKVGSGCSHIDLTSVFICLLSLRFEKRIHVKKEEMFLRVLTSALTTYNKTNPFYVRILYPCFIERYLKHLPATLNKNQTLSYVPEINTFLEILDELARSGMRTPVIDLAVPVCKDLLMNRRRFLSEIFRVPMKKLKGIIGEDLTFEEGDEKVAEAVAKLIEATGKDNISIRAIVRRLNHMKENAPYIVYHNTKYVTSLFRKSKRTFFKTLGMTCSFVDLESYTQGCVESIVEILMSCSNLKDIKHIKQRLGSVVTLGLLKLRETNGKRSAIFKTTMPIKIVFTEVSVLKSEFFAEIKEAVEYFKSLYNIDIVYEIRVREDMLTHRELNGVPEYIRVVSDLHIDINEDKKDDFDFGGDFVVNCGDTSGSGDISANWIKQNMVRGAFIMGNHLGYDAADIVYNKWYLMATPYELADELKRYTKETETVRAKMVTGPLKELSLLENKPLEYEDILYIGATLYTDFKYFGEDKQTSVMMHAARGMNDFKNCYVGIGNSKPRRFTVEDHLAYFERDFNKIKGLLDDLRAKNNKKPIVIVTHHAPSKHSVDPIYANDPLTGAFASDLEDFIREYPEIRLWCHGHVHNSSDYLLGGTRVVCEPYGYHWETTKDPKEYGKRIAMKDIRSAKSWKELLQKEIERGEVKVY